MEFDPNHEMNVCCASTSVTPYKIKKIYIYKYPPSKWTPIQFFSFKLIIVEISQQDQSFFCWFQNVAVKDWDSRETSMICVTGCR